MSEKERGHKSLLILSILVYLGTVGFIILLISGITIDIPPDPPMSDPNWFDTVSENNSLRFRKVARIIGGSFGAIVCILIGSVLLFNYKRGSREEGMITHQTNFFSTQAPSPQKIHCQYCGTLQKQDMTKCPGCGSKRPF